MLYFKLIDGSTIVGIVTQDDFRRYQRKHGMILISDIDRAQCVDYKNTYYHDDWLKPIEDGELIYVPVKIVRIEQDEYQRLYEAFQTDEEIHEDIDDDEQYSEPEVIDEDAVITIGTLKEMKIAEMNYYCRKTIENGFDIVLSDGESHHFSLTTQDQLNLITLSSMVAQGAEQVPYHADGEMCKFYSAADIISVINQATSFKTYHTTYVNALHAYLQSMDNEEQVASVRYGCELPKEYQSDVLIYIIGD